MLIIRINDEIKIKISHKHTFSLILYVHVYATCKIPYDYLNSILYQVNVLMKVTH